MTGTCASLLGLCLALPGCGSTNGPITPAATPAPGSAWTLAWSDEFEGPAGATVDATKWTFDLGGGGFGNQELESYTDRPKNAHLSGDGSLVIDVLRESYVGADAIGRDYTSARLKTQGLFSQTYGRFEARLKLPFGQGLWPAFWMLGTDITSAGWPACGEIDIMENIGREPSIVHGTIHGPGYSGGSGPTAAYSITGAFADDFHIFGVEWDAQAIRWYVDGTLYETRTPADVNGSRWVFDHSFFVILNLAIGGSWPGSPDQTTSFPQELTVDWVRVYTR